MSRYERMLAKALEAERVQVLEALESGITPGVAINTRYEYWVGFLAGLAAAREHMKETARLSSGKDNG
jgi:hypothetical protein